MRVNHKSWRLWLGIIVISCFPLAGISGEKKSARKTPSPDSDQPKIHVHQLDPEFDASQMKQPGVVVHSLEEDEKAEAQGSWHLPPRSVREKMLKDAGLSKDVAEMDEMDRDLLVTKARTFPLARLEESYPKLSKEKLKKLKSVVTEQK